MPGSLGALKGIVGSNHVVTDPEVLSGRSVDHTGRYRGRASALVRPESAERQRMCKESGRDDNRVPSVPDAVYAQLPAEVQPLFQHWREGTR